MVLKKDNTVTTTPAKIVVETTTNIITETFTQQGDKFTITQTTVSTLAPGETTVFFSQTEIYTRASTWINIMTHTHTNKKTETIFKEPKKSVRPDLAQFSIPTNTYYESETRFCIVSLEVDSYPTMAYTKTNIHATYLWTKVGERIKWTIMTPKDEHIFTRIENDTAYNATHKCGSPITKTYYVQATESKLTERTWIETEITFAAATPIPTPEETGPVKDGRLSSAVIITVTNTYKK